jgi:hypothetical protein
MNAWYLRFNVISYHSVNTRKPELGALIFVGGRVFFVCAVLFADEYTVLRAMPACGTWDTISGCSIPTKLDDEVAKVLNTTASLLRVYLRDRILDDKSYLREDGDKTLSHPMSGPCLFSILPLFFH